MTMTTHSSTDSLGSDYTHTQLNVPSEYTYVAYYYVSWYLVTHAGELKAKTRDGDLYVHVAP